MFLLSFSILRQIDKPLIETYRNFVHLIEQRVLSSSNANYFRLHVGYYWSPTVRILWIIEKKHTHYIVFFSPIIYYKINMRKYRRTKFLDKKTYKTLQDHIKAALMSRFKSLQSCFLSSKGLWKWPSKITTAFSFTCMRYEWDIATKDFLTRLEYTQARKLTI